MRERLADVQIFFFLLFFMLSLLHYLLIIFSLCSPFPFWLYEMDERLGRFLRI